MKIICEFVDYEEMLDFAGKLRQGGDPVQAAKSAGQKELKKEKEKMEAEKGMETLANSEAMREDAVYTLMDVRAKLAELQKSGKREQVKGLLEGFGASKLSDVPAEKYAELMQKAGEL